MVRDKKMALGAETIASFPGGKYPSLFVFFVATSSGHTIEENEKEFYSLIEDVKKNKADAETLQREKTKLRASLIRQLDSNAGLAQQLCFFQANFGDWRRMFTQLDEYNKVTADDVMRVAKTYLIENNRTVATTYAPAKETAK
jgi:predicted Zn-dependent peptidase